jgi:DNA polymerase-3 subunit delta'
MTFSTLLGHESVKAGLRASHQNQRVSHAYLFGGPAGVGKTLMATAFAQLVNCKALVENADACGKCHACRLIAEERHPDQIKLEPDGQFIKIGGVREMNNVVRFKPIEANYRVITIHDADRLHPAAANALLKTLEEPAQRNLFLLLSSRPNVVLATIRSRCQLVWFNHLSTETVMQWLTETAQVDSKTALEIATMSRGSISVAQQLTEPDAVAHRQHWLEVLENAPSMDSGELLGLAEKMAQDTQCLRDVLDTFVLGLRDRLLNAAEAPRQMIAFGDRFESQGERGVQSSLNCLRLVSEAERAIERNVNSRLIAENLLLSMRTALGDAQ